MTSEQILQHFQDTNALLDGHFLLSSGLHSPKYLQCALALQYPADAAKFGHAIAAHFVDTGIQTVASPAIGGLVIGYATAAALNTRFLWTERQNGEMTLRRGFSLTPGERILVVEDVITTGGSTREVVQCVEDLGGGVVGVGSLIDRSGGAAAFTVKRVALATVTATTWAPDGCPLCKTGSLAIKPGSRS